MRQEAETLAIEPDAEIHGDGGLCISNSTGGKRNRGGERFRTSENNNDKYLMSSRCMPDSVVGTVSVPLV